MNQEQTYDNCKLFEHDCPRKDDELMKHFKHDMRTVESKASNHYRGRTSDASKGKEVNKLFCNTCDSFKNKRS
jgi:hypothetical protein